MRKEAYMREKYRLEPEKLTTACCSDIFDFETTEELSPMIGIIGQDRAKSAMQFGLDVQRKGYNIYVAGSWGTGRNTFVKLLAEQHAQLLKSPSDWLYANNFKSQHHPIAIEVSPGEGKTFIKYVDRMIRFLRKGIAEIFNSKEYENAKNMLVESYNAKTEHLIESLNDLGTDFGFAFSQSDRGIVSIPLKEGKPMSEEEYKSLSEEEYETMRVNSGKLSVETIDIFNQMRLEEENLRESMKRLDETMGHRLVKFHIDHLAEKYRDNKQVIKYLEILQEDIVDHIDQFKGEDSDTDEPKIPFLAQAKPDPERFFRRYELNLFIDNSDLQHAPVIFESNPTYNNLMGAIEYTSEMGMMKTDFTKIKPGSLHRANGGYLILLAKDILTNPYAWKSLKRSLLDEAIGIESITSAGLGVVTTSLKPEAIPLNVKVIIIGDSRTYGLLSVYDEEFMKLFKVMADFDNSFERNGNAEEQMARFIATQCESNNLKHFERGAVARLIDASSRFADDQSKLTAHLKTIADIIIEADTWATHDMSRLVKREHVSKALREREYRNDKYRKHVLELFEDGTYLLDVEGEKIGEINGLAVVSTGQFSFGKPSKITVSTFRGQRGLLNIEREARTSGKIHDKGVMIIQGYLGHLFAQKRPLALTASIVFEQLYSGVDGDSASSTELYALLSDLAKVPIDQSIAVTGSVNQRGEIQPIGGVNEKIEGFFNVCKIKGFTGKQGVIIPHQNVKNLMLNEEVVNAVKEGTFHIYSVEHIHEGIEILMNVKAGKQNKNGSFERGSLFGKVDRQLKALAEVKRPPKAKAKVGKSEDKKDDEDKKTKDDEKKTKK